MVERKSSIKIELTDNWPDKLCIVIGQIAIAFAQLTREIYLVTKRTEGIAIDEWEREYKSDNLSKWCCEIRKKYNADTKLILLIDQIDTAAKKRHDIFHALWGRHPDGHLGRWRDGKDLGIDPEPMYRLLSEIRKLRNAVNKYSRNSRT